MLSRKNRIGCELQLIDSLVDPASVGPYVVIDIIKIGVMISWQTHPSDLSKLVLEIGWYV